MLKNISCEIIKEFIKMLHKKRKSEETSAIRETWTLGLSNKIRSQRQGLDYAGP